MVEKTLVLRRSPLLLFSVHSHLQQLVDGAAANYCIKAISAFSEDKAKRSVSSFRLLVSICCESTLAKYGSASEPHYDAGLLVELEIFRQHKEEQSQSRTALNDEDSCSTTILHTSELPIVSACKIHSERIVIVTQDSAESSTSANLSVLKRDLRVRSDASKRLTPTCEVIKTHQKALNKFDRFAFIAEEHNCTWRCLELVENLGNGDVLLLLSNFTRYLYKVKIDKNSDCTVETLPQSCAVFTMDVDADRNVVLLGMANRNVVFLNRRTLEQLRCFETPYALMIARFVGDYILGGNQRNATLFAMDGSVKKHTPPPVSNVADLLALTSNQSVSLFHASTKEIVIYPVWEARVPAVARMNRLTLNIKISLKKAIKFQLETLDKSKPKSEPEHLRFASEMVNEEQPLYFSLASKVYFTRIDNPQVVSKIAKSTRAIRALLFPTKTQGVAQTLITIEAQPSSVKDDTSTALYVVFYELKSINRVGKKMERFVELYKSFLGSWKVAVEHAMLTKLSDRYLANVNNACELIEIGKKSCGSSANSSGDMMLEVTGSRTMRLPILAISYAQTRREVLLLHPAAIEIRDESLASVKAVVSAAESGIFIGIASTHWFIVLDRDEEFAYFLDSQFDRNSDLAKVTTIVLNLSDRWLFQVSEITMSKDKESSNVEKKQKVSSIVLPCGDKAVEIYEIVNSK